MIQRPCSGLGNTISVRVIGRRKVEPENVDAIGYVVCGYCRNRGETSCMTECVPEGLYRHLCPARLEEWEFPPGLPDMDEMLGYDSATRLALVKLALHYLGEEVVKLKRPLNSSRKETGKWDIE
jgi:hypothetical protein